MALLALCSAVCWGVADFLGGKAARTTHLLSLTFTSQITGAAALGVIVGLRDVAFPSADVVAIAILTGFAGFISLCGIYGSLALGMMSRIAPLLSLSVAVPITVGLATGERLSAPQFMGIAIVLTGIVLVSNGPTRSQGRFSMRIAVPIAIGTSVCIGLVLVGIERVSEYDHFWGVFMIRAASAAFTLIAAFALLRRRLFRENRPAPIGVPIGLLDATGATLFGVAASLGFLSLAAVLSQTFPLVTALLAVGLLGERLTLLQASGAVLTVAGSGIVISG